MIRKDCQSVAGRTVVLQHAMSICRYFIPINIVAGCLIGCFLGYLVVLICKPPLEYTRLVIFTVGIGKHSGPCSFLVVSENTF
jgi:hypothetical protein